MRKNPEIWKNLREKIQGNLDQLHGNLLLSNLFCLFQLYWVRIRIKKAAVSGSALRKQLDPDLEKMNADSQPSAGPPQLYVKHIYVDIILY